jgi:hypothetical protein
MKTPPEGCRNAFKSICWCFFCRAQEEAALLRGVYFHHLCNSSKHEESKSDVTAHTDGQTDRTARERANDYENVINKSLTTSQSLEEEERKKDFFKSQVLFLWFAIGSQGGVGWDLAIILDFYPVICLVLASRIGKVGREVVKKLDYH